LEEIYSRQLQNPPPVEQLGDAHIPKCMLAVLQSMLQADPAARPQSARELLQVLSKCQGEMTGASGRRSWRKSVAIVALLAATAAGLIWSAVEHGWWAPRNEMSVAVLPLENLSAENKEAFFALGMQDSLSFELGRIAQLKVIGPESTRSFAPGKRNLSAGAPSNLSIVVYADSGIRTSACRAAGICVPMQNDRAGMQADECLRSSGGVPAEILAQSGCWVTMAERPGWRNWQTRQT
jgi:hypothetical protein